MNTRPALLALVLSPALCCASHAAPQKSKPAANSSASSASLRAWAKTQLARQDYGMYMLGRKIGWMTMEFKLVPDSKAPGGQAALSSTQATIRARSAQGAPDLTLTQEQRFALTPGGPLLSARLSTTESGQPTSHTLARKAPGQAFQVTTVSAGKSIARPASQPRETLEQARQMMAWLGGARKKGESFPFWSTSLDAAELNSRESIAFGERKRIAWGGVPSTVYEVTMRSRGIDFNALMRPNGMFVRGQMAGIELRAEEPKLARDLSQGGVDLLSASLIRVDRKLGAPWNLKALKLEASGVPELKLPQSKRQKSTKSGDTFTITMAPELEGNAPQILTAAQRRKYLSATASVQSDQASVVKLARSIVGEERGTLAKSRRLMAWVYANLQKSMDANASTSLQVLANKKGDCTEHALLFTTLARAVGIPAREVSGLAYIESPEPMFGWHAWSEVNDGAGWISIDPTWNQARVDVSHIKFSDDVDDFAWAGAMGRLKLRVLEAR